MEDLGFAFRSPEYHAHDLHKLCELRVVILSRVPFVRPLSLLVIVALFAIRILMT